MIEHLPFLEPDEARSMRTRARCHDRLTALRGRLEARKRPSSATVVAERLLVSGLCVVYLISMAGNLLRLAVLVS